MAYNGWEYLLVFLPIVLLVYQLTPQKHRWITLLLAGYIFFWSVSGKLVLYLIGTTLFTHYIAVWLAWIKAKCRTDTAACEKTEAGVIRKACRRKEKHVLIFGICALLGVLIWLKYYNFFIYNINLVLAHNGSDYGLPVKQLLVPIGISFYTLQAIGYMTDVYWEKVEVFRHPGKIALFLGFFPQIMEGPISSYSQTADQLWEGNALTVDNLSKGSIRIFWGLFKKLVIADRLDVLVGVLFNQYESYQGVMILIAAVAYTIQLYMEFSGCMDMIIGSGKLFGIVLPENFRQPFFSQSASEFWRRWHITLGEWFKTYIFYPVSVSSLVKKWNKFGKKHYGKYMTRLGVSAMCLFPVWLCNGLWHGPRWNYIFYGMYYFVILLGEVAFEPVGKKLRTLCHIHKESLPCCCFRILKTWIIIFTGELFFRADWLSQGMEMLRSAFTGWPALNYEACSRWKDSIYYTMVSLGLDKGDYYVIIAGIIVVAVWDTIKEMKLLGEEGLRRLWRPVRWAIYYGLIMAVLMLGAYGIGYTQVDMIYAGF